MVFLFFFKFLGKYFWSSLSSLEVSFELTSGIWIVSAIVFGSML